jgi:hypothetical protein
VEQHLVTWGGDGDRDKALLDESMQVRESGDGMVECEGPAQLPHGNSWFQLVSVADRSLRFPPAVLPCGLCVAQLRTLPPAREAIRRCNANAAVLLQPPRSRAVAGGASGGSADGCGRRLPGSMSESMACTVDAGRGAVCLAPHCLPRRALRGLIVSPQRRSR